MKNRSLLKLNILLAFVFVNCGPLEPEQLWRRKTQPIINGKPDTSQQNQAVVGIIIESSMLCSGTLVDRDIILTAGHCAAKDSGETRDPAQFKILFGDTISNAYATRSVVEVMLHPNYRLEGRVPVNDIAMLRMNSFAPEDVAVIPVLPKWFVMNSDLVGVRVANVGYGKTETDESGVKLMVNNTIDFICDKSSICDEWTILALPFTFCSFQYPGGACRGDSGGPVLLTVDTKVYVAGVSSYGDKFCKIASCSTKVDVFADFIRTAVSNDGDLGDSCIQDADCNSSYCVEGTCCDTACQGVCQTCNHPGSIGICSPDSTSQCSEDKLHCADVENCPPQSGVFEKSETTEPANIVGKVGCSTVGKNSFVSIFLLIGLFLVVLRRRFCCTQN